MNKKDLPYALPLGKFEYEPPLLLSPMCDEDVAVADLLAGNDTFPTTLLLVSSGQEGFVLVSWSVG